MDVDDAADEQWRIVAPRGQRQSARSRRREDQKGPTTGPLHASGAHEPSLPTRPLVSLVHVDAVRRDFLAAAIPFRCFPQSTGVTGKDKCQKKSQKKQQQHANKEECGPGQQHAASSTLQPTAASADYMVHEGLIATIVHALHRPIAATLLHHRQDEDNKSSTDDGLATIVTVGTGGAERAIDAAGVVPVDIALLGVGELDNPSSVLQAGFGFAVADALDGTTIDLPSAPRMTTSGAPAPAVWTIHVENIFTFDPLLQPNSSTSSAKNTNTTKGLDVLMQREEQRWRKRHEDAAPSAHSAELSKPEPQQRRATNIFVDGANRKGAYAVQDRAAFAPPAALASHHDAPRRAPSILIAFTPHCPRALYHNLIVANLPQEPTPLAVDGPTPPSAPASLAAVANCSQPPQYPSAPLRRLIVVGNDITGYLKPDKHCILDGLFAQRSLSVPPVLPTTHADLVDAAMAHIQRAGHTHPPASRSVPDNQLWQGGPAVQVTHLSKAICASVVLDGPAAEAGGDSHTPKNGTGNHVEGTAIDVRSGIDGVLGQSTTVDVKLSMTGSPASTARPGCFGPYRRPHAESAFCDLCIVAFGNDTPASPICSMGQGPASTPETAPRAHPPSPPRVSLEALLDYHRLVQTMGKKRLAIRSCGEELL